MDILQAPQHSRSFQTFLSIQRYSSLRWPSPSLFHQLPTTPYVWQTISPNIR